MPNVTGSFDAIVAAFGAKCAEKLAGPGDQEAAIRAPLEALLDGVGKLIGIPAVMHDEVRDAERQVRPDYGVSVNKAIMGYIEVKAPGRTLDPTRFTGHDKVQWERQRDLPNLIYTNGTRWRLYRDGEPVGAEVVLTEAPLQQVGAQLSSSPALETLLTDFLRWKAAPITSVTALVRAVAPLTRLLRGEVTDQLKHEQRLMRAGASADDQPFTGLASDWRKLLFPQADDTTFADGYAQAVTFALLLARTEDIALTGRGLHEIGADLGTEHSLMGRALQLLTDDVAADFKVVLDLLVSVIGAVRWDRIRQGRRDVYLYLYEQFLEAYDPAKRQASGTYYTPRELVAEMVRLVEEVLVGRLGIADGFGDPEVCVVDPAMGTGTYLHTIVDRVQAQVAAADGPGAVPGAVSELARRLVGFEIQMGPYAVAELRITDLLATLGATLPAKGLPLFVTDTLDDPYAAETQLASGLSTIAKARREANKVKASQPVTVVIGNPPYRELAAGAGGWVEHGTDAPGDRTHASGILEDFLYGVPGRLSAKLKNLYVYFYRWATWKVWESTPADQAGVVCFITTSGYLTGPAFTAMRSYLRRESTAGWIIDLTPEGQTPDVPTRIFPGVRQPLAIGLFVRQPDNDTGEPADLHYNSLSGSQAQKFSKLGALDLGDPGWQPVRTDWTAPFTPAPRSDWDSWPAASDLLPWYSPGLFPTRTWVYSPSPAALEARWARLVAEPGVDGKNALMKAGRDANATKTFPPLPGSDVVQGTEKRLEWEDRTSTRTVQIGYRAFDRQHVIADRRLFDMPRLPLWAARQPGQVYMVEQHRHQIRSGPALVFTHLVPDFDYFNARGGRTLPWLHPNGSPNLPDGLTQALSDALAVTVAPEDVLAYLAAIASHPGFTERFAAELETPGVRVPITADPNLWTEAIGLGRQVLWAHTYGAVFHDSERPEGNVRYPAGDPHQVRAITPVQGLPDGHSYDSVAGELVVGTGRFGPVTPEVAAYAVGGRNIIKSWVDYRKAEPAGRRSTPLDDINPTEWEHAWTGELIELLTVLDRLTRLEPEQTDVLDRVLVGPLILRSELSTAGVCWGTNSRPWGDSDTLL